MGVIVPVSNIREVHERGVSVEGSALRFHCDTYLDAPRIRTPMQSVLTDVVPGYLRSISKLKPMMLLPFALIRRTPLPERQAQAQISSYRPPTKPFLLR